MEYPSKNDFFIRFKALINGKGRFVDYVLVEVSDNFNFATGINSDRILGNKLSKMVVELEESVLSLKDFHYHMIPKTRRKFEHYAEKENRLYLVSLYSDEREYLVMVYTDITKYTERLKDINKIKNNHNETDTLKQTV